MTTCHSEEEIAAAIAIALKLHESAGIQAKESGRITIRRQESEWSCKALSMRKKPGNGRI